MGTPGASGRWSAGRRQLVVDVFDFRARVVVAKDFLVFLVLPLLPRPHLAKADPVAPAATLKDKVVSLPHNDKGRAPWRWAARGPQERPKPLRLNLDRARLVAHSHVASTAIGSGSRDFRIDDLSQRDSARLDPAAERRLDLGRR